MTCHITSCLIYQHFKLIGLSAKGQHIKTYQDKHVLFVKFHKLYFLLCFFSLSLISLISSKKELSLKGSLQVPRRTFISRGTFSSRKIVNE